MTLFEWEEEESAMAEATQELARLEADLDETPAVGSD